MLVQVVFPRSLFLWTECICETFAILCSEQKVIYVCMGYLKLFSCLLLSHMAVIWWPLKWVECHFLYRITREWLLLLLLLLSMLLLLLPDNVYETRQHDFSCFELNIFCSFLNWVIIPDSKDVKEKYMYFKIPTHSCKMFASRKKLKKYIFSYF